MKPLKRFGQNYLKDSNIINKIVGEINPAKDDLIIEIGPGQGALTKKLLEKVEKLYAVEIDRRVIEELSSLENLNITEGDFLEFNLQNLYKKEAKKIRITGNIPYNLTSPIIFKMIENHNIIDDSVLMVQLEVAKRMISGKGSKDYGIFSVLMKYFTDTEFCFKVSPNVFYPKPKVFSAVIHIKFKEQKRDEDFNKLFIQVVKASFGNRRKTIKNSFSNSIFKAINFSEAGIDLTLRAEQLDIEDFIQLTNFVRSKQNSSDAQQNLST